MPTSVCSHDVLRHEWHEALVHVLRDVRVLPEVDRVRPSDVREHDGRARQRDRRRLDHQPEDAVHGRDAAAVPDADYLPQERAQQR